MYISLALFVSFLSTPIVVKIHRLTVYSISYVMPESSEKRSYKTDLVLCNIPG